MIQRRLHIVLSCLVVLILAFPAGAQIQSVQQQVLPQQKKPKRFPCGAGFVLNDISPIKRVSYRLTDVTAGALRLSFIGHATFLLESPGGVRVITDYNDYFRAKVLPDIATMNIDRGNHASDIIDPSIKYVLQGWDSGQGIVRHDVTYKDVRVYNLPTNITDFGSSFSNFSSMFIIQSAGLCVSHMGHLQHMLDRKQLARIGRIDVLLIPIDSRVTQSYEELLHNIKGISPRLVIPMHFNAMFTAEEFLKFMSGVYPVKRTSASTIEISRQTLPRKTEILFITPKEPHGGGFGSQL